MYLALAGIELTFRACRVRQYSWNSAGDIAAARFITTITLIIRIPAGRRGLYFGSLFPFALNASPNDVSGPPPAGLVWHVPQDLPVSLANWAVAEAGRAASNEAAPVSASAAARLNVVTRVILAFIGIFSGGDSGSDSADSRREHIASVCAVSRRGLHRVNDAHLCTVKRSTSSGRRRRAALVMNGLQRQ
jgi:hypothetical protein